MKIKTLIALGVALIALDAAQASFAATAPGSAPAASSANPTYYPTGETSSLPNVTLPAALVREQAVAVSHTLSPSWSEFGAGSHEESLSTQTRAEVRNEAVNVSHPATRTYFSY